MGTNYYLHLDVCPHCNRSSEAIHIGKSSVGWSFSFRGYRLSGDGYPDLDFPCGYDWPFKKITSAAEWREVIEWAERHAAAVIMDEYGKPLTAADFWEWVDRKRGGKNHGDECKKSDHDWVRLHGQSDCWTDEDGNSFNGREFF